VKTRGEAGVFTDPELQALSTQDIADLGQALDRED
jgi:hypothetical protein